VSGCGANDILAVIGAIFSAVAALAAVFAVVQAKHAANASREAVLEERRLRIEESYRELGRGLWAVRQAARQTRDEPDNQAALDRLRDAQTALQTSMVVPLWVDLGADAPRLMDRALSPDSDPATVTRAASLLTAQLQNAWDRRPELGLRAAGTERGPRRSWTRPWRARSS
jgi:hypothetical protein